MEKETKNTKKTTVKKTAVKKDTTKKARTPKQIEVAEAIVDDVEVEETIEVEEVVPRKTYKELKREFRSKQYEIEVEILNLNSCGTSCRGRDGRLIFDFNKSGDREFINLADLLEVANRYKGYFEKHQIAIIDIDNDEYDLEDIITYLNLDEIYQENEIENYDTDYIGQILKMDTKKFKRLVEDADVKLVKTIAGRAVELFRNGKFDSRIKEEVLCKRLNREDLFEM